MVTYESDDVFPKPRVAVLALLQDHLDDTKIRQIHHLISSQTTISRGGDESVVERWIDVRGKALRSVWKLTFRPPDTYRWEVVESQGPWSVGSFLESSYSDDPGGTRIRSTGELTISVLPFFMSQRSNVRKVLDTIDAEDRAFAP